MRAVLIPQPDGAEVGAPSALSGCLGATVTSLFGGPMVSLSLNIILADSSTLATRALPVKGQVSHSSSISTGIGLQSLPQHVYTGGHPCMVYSSPTRSSVSIFCSVSR